MIAVNHSNTSGLQGQQQDIEPIIWNIFQFKRLVTENTTFDSIEENCEVKEDFGEKEQKYKGNPQL